MDNFKELTSLFSKIEVSEGSAKTACDEAISKVTKLIIKRNKEGAKLIFIGNGGSASIASHIATDFLKNVGFKAICFNDSSLLTCLSNDLGYEHVFEKPIEVLAEKDDILFAISSSGKSENILKAAEMARTKGCFLITLSGFSSQNPLRQLGDINFYLSSHSYGYVEIIHLAICHCIVDHIMKDNG